MNIRRIFAGANKHLNDNLGYYLLTVLFIATGMIVGLYCVKYMQDGDRSSLITYLSEITTKPTETMSATKIFMGALKNNLPIIIGLWVVGLIFIGAPVILLINLYKGFSLGFTFSFFIYALKEKGILLALLGVLPQNIIYIPCIIFLSVIALKYSVEGIKEKFSKKYVSPEYNNVGNYTMIFLIATGIMVGGFFIEAFLTPIFIKLIL